MEFKMDSVTYILPIDSVDIDFMSVCQHQMTSDDAPIPIWSANKHVNEYCKFEVHAETFEDDAESDGVENQNTQPCHICNVDVPTAYIKEHYSSNIHKTLLQITENAIERSRKQISTGMFILDKEKSDRNLFCVSCIEVVKLKDKNQHDGSKKHIASVKYENLIKEFATAFTDKESFINNACENTKETRHSNNPVNLKKQTSNDTVQQNLMENVMDNNKQQIVLQAVNIAPTISVNKKQTSNDTVQQNFTENTMDKKQGLVSQAVNIASTKSVNAKQQTWCHACNVFITPGKANTKRHKKSSEHVYNSSIFRVGSCIYHHIKPCQQNQMKATCKVCNMLVPSNKEDIECHTNSVQHILRFNQMLENNFVRRKHENMDVFQHFQLFCGACCESFLEFEFFQHIDTKSHKKSVSKKPTGDTAIIGTEVIGDNVDDFVNDFTTKTFTNSNINQQNSSYAITESASTSAKPQFIDRNSSRNERPTQAAQTYSGARQPVCQPSMSSNDVSQTDQMQNRTRGFHDVAWVIKHDEYSYDFIKIKDFDDKINKPSTSTQPDIVQNMCKKDVKEVKPNNADTETVIGHNDYIAIFDKTAHCQLCNSNITNSVKDIQDHVASRRHKYLETLLNPNYIVWDNGRFFCHICLDTVKDQKIFIHIQRLVHKNAKLEYERNTNQKADDGSNKNAEACKNTPEVIFCTICNEYIRKSRNIREHLMIHVDIKTDMLCSKYLEKLGVGKVYRCKLCGGFYNKKVRGLLHVVGEDHLNIFTSKAPVVDDEAESSIGDTHKKIEVKDTADQIDSQEIERAASDDEVSEFPKNIFCEICNDTILVTHIRKHFKEYHAHITNMLVDFKIYFEHKGHNIYRCEDCDFVLYGKWNAQKHVLGKHHYRLLTQLNEVAETKGSIEDGTASSEGALANLTNIVKEQKDKFEAWLCDMSYPFYNKKIDVYDSLNDVEQDELSNDQQHKNEDEAMADDWCDL